MPLPHMAGVARSASPGVISDMSELELKEAGKFVWMGRTKNALGMNGLSYKLYKNYPLVLVF